MLPHDFDSGGGTRVIVGRARAHGGQEQVSAMARKKKQAGETLEEDATRTVRAESQMRLEVFSFSIDGGRRWCAGGRVAGCGRFGARRRWGRQRS